MESRAPEPQRRVRGRAGRAARPRRRAGRHRGALRPGGERARGDAVPAPGRAGVRRRAPARPARPGAPWWSRGGTRARWSSRRRTASSTWTPRRTRAPAGASRSSEAAAERQGLDAIRAGIEARDDADRTRSVAPLARSADATYVDSSEMTVDEVVELMAQGGRAGVLYATLKRMHRRARPRPVPPLGGRRGPGAAGGPPPPGLEPPERARSGADRRRGAARARLHGEDRAVPTSRASARSSDG